MKERRQRLESSQFLSGWKEIAAYLGKGVRTTQRYERELGLPVRRPAGKPWGSVIATKAELDGWVKASPIRQAYHLRNPQPDSVSQASALRNHVTQMAELRGQMLALRNEVRRSVGLLHNSICELQDTLKSRPRQDFSPYSQGERELLERGAWGVRPDLPKAS